MPEPVAQLEQPVPILGGHDAAVRHQIGEIGHSGAEPPIAGLSDIAGGRVFLELAKMQREPELLRVGQRLVAKDQHAMFAHACVDGGDVVRGQWRGAVDPCHFSREARWRSIYGNRHFDFPRAPRRGVLIVPGLGLREARGSAS